MIFIIIHICLDYLLSYILPTKIIIFIITTITTTLFDFNYNLNLFVFNSIFCYLLLNHIHSNIITIYHTDKHYLIN